MLFHMRSLQNQPGTDTLSDLINLGWSLIVGQGVYSDPRPGAHTTQEQAPSERSQHTFGIHHSDRCSTPIFRQLLDRGDAKGCAVIKAHPVLHAARFWRAITASAVVYNYREHPKRTVLSTSTTSLHGCYTIMQVKSRSRDAAAPRHATPRH
ncbi:Zinc finger protein 467, partial [Frankliniella fusca]